MLPRLQQVATRAHPRPCGEHPCVVVVLVGNAGSSPPVRGALMTNDKKTEKVGLIPARAGSTHAHFMPPFR